MAGASPLTVRANFRMVFDDGAADKAQANYMNRLAAMEREQAKGMYPMYKKAIQNDGKTIQS